MKKKNIENQQKIQRNDAENANLIEEGKKIGINVATKYNEIINNDWKYKYV